MMTQVRNEEFEQIRQRSFMQKHSNAHPFAITPKRIKKKETQAVVLKHKQLLMNRRGKKKHVRSKMEIFQTFFFVEKRPTLPRSRSFVLQ